jgi:sulfur-carrier protein
VVAVRILYFATFREAIGLDEEVCDIPPDVLTPGAVADWLSARGAPYADVFADRTRLRCAVDHDMLALDAVFGSVSEIAFFPPVTGG